MDVPGSPSTVSLAEEAACAVLIVWGLRGFLCRHTSQWGVAHTASEPELMVDMQLDELPQMNTNSGLLRNKTVRVPETLSLFLLSYGGHLISLHQRFLLPLLNLLEIKSNRSPLWQVLLLSILSMLGLEQ